MVDCVTRLGATRGALPDVIFIEPFYGGSHKALIDTLTCHVEKWHLVSLPAKKWHWRARCGVLMLQDSIPKVTTENVLFCSSVLNLAELLGMRPDLQLLKKIVYFHENQLVYPVREIKQRDIQYAYNQITTCVAADIVLFNSVFNRTSFLENVNKVLKIFPDSRPKNLNFTDKCKVLYFPMEYPKVSECRRAETLHIAWPHRWEFDKGPEDFFEVLFRLKAANLNFKVSILGESFTNNPPIFSKAKEYLKDHIIKYGYVENRGEYFKILESSHVVVSTAKHEFFGVSMLEATYCGCFPLAPNALVYPEIYPSECLYLNVDELYNRLKSFCLNPTTATENRKKLEINFKKYDVATVTAQFKQLLNDML